MFGQYRYTVIPIDMVGAEGDIPPPVLLGWDFSLLQTEKKGLFLICTWGGQNNS